MKRFFVCLWRAVWRVSPYIPQAQAIAFNMFWSFLPILLVILGLVARSLELRAALLEGVGHLRYVLPPGSTAVLVAFLTRTDTDAWTWITLGLAGTLLVGTQMMRQIIIGFAMVYGDERRIPFWTLNFRALLLLLITILPALLAVHLIVFGNEVRHAVAVFLNQPSALLPPNPAAPQPFGIFWSVAYFIVALALSIVVLALIYRIGRPHTANWRSALPGAMLAATLWWLASRALGTYVRHVPYSDIYGGLAAAIGLMAWMEITAIIILLGAGFNAEWAAG